MWPGWGNLEKLAKVVTFWGPKYPLVRTTFLMQLSRQVCAGRWMFVTGACLRNASCTGWVNRMCRSLCPVNLSTWPQLAVQVWEMGKAAFSWLERVSNVRQGSPQKVTELGCMRILVVGGLNNFNLFHFLSQSGLQSWVKITKVLNLVQATMYSFFNLI